MPLPRPNAPHATPTRIGFQELTHQEDRLASAWLDTTLLLTVPASNLTAMPILSAPSANRALKSASSAWPPRRE